MTKFGLTTCPDTLCAKCAYSHKWRSCVVIDKLGCKAGHIKYMEEGFGAWQAAGYPVEPYEPE